MTIAHYAGSVLAFTGLTILATAYVFDIVLTGKLRRLVWQNLDNAWDGGCFNHAQAGYLHGMTASEIADDMELYCDDALGYHRDDLTPHVQAWLERNAQKVYPS